MTTPPLLKWAGFTPEDERSRPGFGSIWGHKLLEQRHLVVAPDQVHQVEEGTRSAQRHISCGSLLTC